MVKTVSLNREWNFFKGCEGAGDMIDLPHTWNAVDGQDGGNDYYRGRSLYVKRLNISEGFERYIIRFGGVNSICDVVVNGKSVCHHEGGYSWFDADITDALQSSENILEVYADNTLSDRVYPQTADFTMYGGIYRAVNLRCLKDAWFSDEIKAVTAINGRQAAVCLSLRVSGCFDDVCVSLADCSGKSVASSIISSESFIDGFCTKVLSFADVHPWNGLDDPYLYCLKAQILRNNEISDEKKLRVGFRTFCMDPDRGFILNGREYPLHGVAKHQDREGKGNAVSFADMEEDINLIIEAGFNAVRLAHYQHDQYTYNLCDEKGLVVWAEIPYISEHTEEGRENAISQMTELVNQNINHPSVVCWALSNEITAVTSPDSESLYNDHIRLNSLVHDLDPSRPTVMAHAFMLPPDNRLVSITDLISYNLYYGWYLGDVSGNASFLDRVHHMYPGTAVALSEFGADAAVKYQTANPVKGDFSEQYQALYHEKMCRIFEKRPYLWATFVWSMFDFGADARIIGEFKGFNRKGLVTADRKIRKDAFYAVKAFYSKEKFVHIASKRYVNRTEDISCITVYSNCSEVSLYNNGILIETKTSDKVFEFQLNLAAENSIEAVSGELRDSAFIRHVDKADSSYINPSAANPNNWISGLELQRPEGYFSIFDRIGEIMNSKEGESLVLEIMSKRDSDKEGIAAKVKLDRNMMARLMESMTMEEVLKAMNADSPRFVEINSMLNKIVKTEKST